MVMTNMTSRLGMSTVKLRSAVSMPRNRNLSMAGMVKTPWGGCRGKREAESGGIGLAQGQVLAGAGARMQRFAGYRVQR